MKQVWLALTLLAVAGCGYDIEKNPAAVSPAVPPQNNGGTTTGGAVTFAQIQRDVLTPACTKCHGGAGGAGGADMASYGGVMEWVSAGQPDSSELVVLIQSGRMPKRAPKLSDDKIAAVRAWIAAGAPNN